MATSSPQNLPPDPLRFEPILMPRLWGGRKLADLLGKKLPPGERIGESWELVSLPGRESIVADGPLAGRSLQSLIDAHRTALLGDAPLVDDRFPLLIKFLDAAEHLSVQVHPKPGPGGDDDTPGVKHEAWYVIHAEPGARLFIGLKPGVTPRDVAAAALFAGPVSGEPVSNRSRTPPVSWEDLLQPRPVRTGDCFYLPSGTLHALGAGILVAEVQTPSDVTYRLYDWDRLDAAGRPRELHLEQGLANIRYDVREDEIISGTGFQLVSSVPTSKLTRTNVCTCPRFRIDALHLARGPGADLPPDPRARIWMAVSGWARLTAPDRPLDQPLSAGDTLLLPACTGPLRVQADDALRWLEIRV